MCFEFDFAIVSDGGAVDPGSGNHGYGSYCEVQCKSRKEWRSSVTQEKVLFNYQGIKLPV